MTYLFHSFPWLLLDVDFNIGHVWILGQEMLAQFQGKLLYSFDLIKDINTVIQGEMLQLLL